MLKMRNLSVPILAEPLLPKVSTAIPGPLSISYLNQYSSTCQDSATVKMFIDYSKSIGNYMADADGNYILDLCGQDGTLAVGYNHKDISKYSLSAKVKLDLLHRTACAVMPSSHWKDQIQTALLPIAPQGLTEVFNSCGCSHNSNENAMKAASLWFYRQKYGEKYSDEQLKTALTGNFPGIPEFSLLKFSGAFHGNYFGGMSASGGKNDYPNFNWPTALYPKNKEEEAKSLEGIREIFKKNKSPIMAAIYEPIQQIGTYYARKEYCQAMQEIVKANGAALIIDESFSGFGGTGRMWAFEEFGLKPDILVFGGKCQTSGYFAKPEFRPSNAWQILNTWCGDAVRLEIFKGVREITESGDLINKAKSTGEYLKKGIEGVLEHKAGKTLRGKGLHIAFDLESKEKTWQLSNRLLQNGVHVNVVKENTIQLHPSLVFEKKHADIFIDTLENSL